MFEYLYIIYIYIYITILFKILLPNPSPNPDTMRHNIRANILWETQGVTTVDIDHKKTDSSRITLPPNFLAAQAPTT